MNLLAQHNMFQMPNCLRIFVLLCPCKLFWRH
nr:MAG TPA: hypothetical protein [Caudoviricetes sp.]